MHRALALSGNDPSPLHGPPSGQSLSAAHGALLALLYVATGKLSLLLALPPGYASAIFPPAGLALAASLIWGRPSLPWIFAGSLALNAWISFGAGHPLNAHGFAAAAAIAAASTLQAGAGGRWLRHIGGGSPSFEQGRTVARFLLSAPVICLLSATLAVGSLGAMGIVAGADAPLHWLTWWLGDTLGVIVFAPLALVFVGRPRERWAGRRLAVAGPTLLAFALCVLLYLKNTRWEHEQSLRDFQLQSTQLADQVSARFEEQEFLVGQLAALMSQSGRPALSRAEFARFVADALARFPMIQAVEWAPLVTAAQRPRYEAQRRAELPGFAVREVSDDGGLVAAHARDTYVPVDFIEPLASNEKALGYDLASSPDRRAAIDGAFASGRPLATSPLTLVQETQRQPGILLLQRVDGGPNGPGVVLTALRVGDFLRGAVARNQGLFELRLTDVAARTVVYDSGKGGAAGATAASGPSDAADAPVERSLSFGTRPYRLQVLPSAAYLAQHRGWQSLSLLALGLLGTGLLAALLMTGTGQAARLDRLVAERTAALERASRKNRILLRNSSDGIHILDRNGNVVEASDAFCAMLGRERAEVIGMNVRQWDASLTEQDIAGMLSRQITGPARIEFQTRHRRKDGSVFDVEVSGAALELDGEPVIFNSSRDITQRLQAKQLLLKLSKAVEQSPVATFITDTDRRIEYVNDAFVNSTGYSRDEAIGADPRLLRSGRTPDAAYDALWAALSQGLSWKGEFVNRRKDGSEYTVFTVVSPIRAGDGRVTHFVSVQDDITERKRLAGELARHRLHLEELVGQRTAELQRAKLAAEAASVAKSSFLANISHEIRTPLNGVLGMTGLLRQSGLTAGQAGYLDKIDTSGRHLLGIINDILDLSSVEAGRLRIDASDFALADVINRAVAAVGDRARLKRLELRVDFAAAPQRLHGDGKRLSQALINYLDNAIKFTESGRVSLSCAEAGSDSRGRLLRFQVTDTGIGMTAEQLSRVFEPFEQADASTTRRYGGSGLGLAITKRLAGLMGGEVGASSVVGQGSTFWMTARFGEAAAPGAGAQAPESAEAVLQRDFHGAPVLVAEDNPIGQEVARHVLECAGLEVDIAADGAAAVRMAAARDYRAILMDMQMPGMDGLQATAAIRALTGRQSVPIIAMTANAFEEDRRRCLGAGMSDFLTKPLDRERMLSVLVQWMSAPDGASRGDGGGQARRTG